jgi:hypothetical protein
MSNELYVDFTPPTTEISKINTLNYMPAVLTSDTTPTIFGQITDQLFGSPEDRKVAAGPKELLITIEKKELLNHYSQVLKQIVPLADIFWESDGKKIDDNTLNSSNKFAPFEFTITQPLKSGIYRVTIQGRDQADNAFGAQVFQIRVGSKNEIVAVLSDDEKIEFKDDEDITINDPEGIKISIPEQQKDVAKKESAVTDKTGRKKRNTLGWLLLVLPLLVFMLLFFIWKRKKKKPKGEHV